MRRFLVFIGDNGAFSYFFSVFLFCLFFDFKVSVLSNYFYDVFPSYRYFSHWTGREGKIFVWFFFSVLLFPIAFFDFFHHPLRDKDFLKSPLRHLCMFFMFFLFTMLLFASDLNIDAAAGRAEIKYQSMKNIGLGYYIIMPLLSLGYCAFFSYSVAIVYFYVKFLMGERA